MSKKINQIMRLNLNMRLFNKKINCQPSIRIYMVTLIQAKNLMKNSNDKYNNIKNKYKIFKRITR